MERILKNLKPEKLFYYFEEVTRIPRGSGNEKEISDYLLNLSKNKGWEVFQDEFLNIIIRKPATKGYENAPVVMIQGHMDMVCEKNEGIEHDFEKDPIALRIIDGCIYATETTLGADNGIAVAMALAILDSDDLSHPELEVFISVDEEKGMTGAIKVDGSIFKSKYLLNLDSEEEGIFTSGCAGGCDISFKIPIIEQNTNEKNAYKVVVKGLLGGHSGAEIHKERGNANKILGRVLYDIQDDVELVKINGGSKTNAIPRESYAVFTTDKIDEVKDKIKFWNEILKNEFTFTDPSVTVLVQETNTKEVPIKKDCFKKIVSAINIIPSGVLSRSTVIDLVISSNNLGVITTEKNFVNIYNSSRSSVETLLTCNVEPMMKQIAETLDIKCKVGNYYPGWEYAKKSEVRELCIDTYKELYNKEPKVEAIHAGLECGLLMKKVQGLDAISIGPDTWDVHSPNEHISIKSIENTYYFICEVLKRAK
ncbi:dipeptidase D [Sedimentibacter acidaminivorans]|uniref:Dipeptidase D n=1 Tax=Sedimentibacter acidaminivorans TaxID=913099 RepID=A0ABS4GBI2_9FIRM|nr:aminoacyl-histidine dipeptidase [Sedimentibacter acidaminivorans]MBP1925049.1 dipeptidase D [Sedimentibacter acidaminivorans]